MKKYLSLLLIMAMLLSVLSACGDTSQSTETGETATDSTTSDTGEMVELDIHWHGYDTYTLVDDNGDLLPVFQLAAEQTNMIINSTANPVSTNSVEELQLQATEQFPADIYGSTDIKNTIQGYALQGAFIPLNDLIEEHAPNMKAFFDENPEEKASMTSADGNIYMIHFMPDGETGKVYWIRTDWLDTLGYDMPTTFEELEEILYAFRYDDPNGNGIQDEIPYINERYYETIRLVNLWGARAYSSENFVDRLPVDENDQIYQAWMTDEFKVGIENLNRWYEDGIIDPETFTRQVNTVKSLLWVNEDVGGMTHEWLASTSIFNANEDILARTPEFKVEAFLPVSANGEPFEEHNRSAVQADGWAISASCEDPVAAIKFMDWFFTEEGRRAANFGIEGESYTMVDGVPTFTDEVLDSGAVNIHLRSNYGAQLNLGYKQDYGYESQWTNEAGVEAYNLYAAHPEIRYESWTPMLNFTDEEMDVYNKLISALTDYQDEKITAYITGKEDINETWDEYIEQCKALGADDLVAVYQSAYDRYLSAQ